MSQQDVLQADDRRFEAMRKEDWASLEGTRPKSTRWGKRVRWNPKGFRRTARLMARRGRPAAARPVRLRS